MDARTLAKSAKALILASGLIAASTVLSAAQDAPIPLGTPATVALSSWYVAPPSGQALLLGHAFDLTAGNLILFSNNQSVSFTGSFANAKAVDLLLNTSNTYVIWYDQAQVGTIVLTFSDGTTLSTALIAGVNVREWRPNSTLTVNTVTSGSAPAWTGTAQPAMGGGTAVIDMLTIAAGGKTLTGVTVQDTNTFGALKIQLSGLTVELNAPTPPPTPTPTPTPTCTMNDHAGKVSATKAQNVPHCIAKGKDDAKGDSEKTDTKTIDLAEKVDAETADRAAARTGND